MKVSKKRNSQWGFTLIELVIVIVVIGILAAAVIPRFTDLSASARAATMQANKSAVQSAYALYIASNSGTQPTVTQLATYLQTGGTSVTAAATGIQFVVGGTTYTVLTYTDAACATATSAASDTVGCIGNYS